LLFCEVINVSSFVGCRLGLYNIFEFLYNFGKCVDYFKHACRWRWKAVAEVPATFKEMP
jgi:hypothetical protein